MTLQKWISEGRLRSHQSSAKEIAELFRVVERDLGDAGLVVLSADRRFATAYNAALQLATILLRAAGYRTTGTAHHWVTFQALPEILGESQRGRAGYFDRCRVKRNFADYDQAGLTSEGEVDELLEEVTEFKQMALDWLSRHQPTLCSPRTSS